MKRILIFIIALVPIFAFAKRPKNVRLVMTKPIYNEQCVYNDWGAVISFEWNDYKNYGVTVSIKNETDSRIYVEWGNARIEDETVCFGNDNSLTYRDKKEDEVIHAGSTCERFIARQSEFEIDGREFFYMNMIKRYGDSGERDIIIPIRFEDKTIDYRFSLKVIADTE